MTLLPEYKIRFKDESFFMKLIGKILVFNPSFMTGYTTTIGHTIYFPKASYLKAHPVSAKVTVLHELVHIKDYEKLGALRFILMYLFPQVLALLAIPAFFLLPWWVAILFLAFAAPIPAYGRMQLELKAYTFSVYTLFKLQQKNGYSINFEKQINSYTNQFLDSSYYFMWPFRSYIYTKLTDALAAFSRNTHPEYDAELYSMIDEAIDNDLKLF